MTRNQKNIITILSIVTLALVVGLGYYVYTTLTRLAQTPLGPSLPFMPPQEMPATWTAGPITQTSTIDPSIPTRTSVPATPSGPQCGRTGVMNLLVIGADARADTYNYGLGDAIRLVRIDFSKQTVSALEFPRDLWVEIPHIADNLNGQDHEKLNQAYLYGQPVFLYWDDPSQGSGLTALTLNLNFGAKIDHYVTVNMRTFEKIINAMGGIEVNIPNDEVAEQASLSVGTHTLNGAQALKLARNRSEGIFKRADNQNLVLCAIRKKLTSPQGERNVEVTSNTDLVGYGDRTPTLQQRYAIFDEKNQVVETKTESIDADGAGRYQTTSSFTLPAEAKGKRYKVESTLIADGKEVKSNKYTVSWLAGDWVLAAAY